MISLEQVQLLEERVSKAVDYVKRVSAENAALTAEKAALMQKMESNQKRVDELEVLVLRFKEDQGRIEDGVLAALDRLSQFEEAFERSLKDDKPQERKSSPKMVEKNEFFEIEDNADESSEASEESELDIF